MRLILRGWVLSSVVLVAALLPRAAAGAPAVGQEFRWHVTLQAALEGMQAQAPAVSSLAGEWCSTIVAVRTDGYDARVQLLSVRLTGRTGGSLDPSLLEAAQERLSTPFWVTYATDGSMTAVHFQRTVPVSDRNLLQTIATETQFVRSDAARAVWTTVERDGGGTYSAIYQRLGGGQVRKKKVKYVGGASTDAGAPPIAMTIEASQANYRISPDGAVASVESLQHIRMGLPGGQSSALSTRIDVRLSDLRAKSAVPVAGAGVPVANVDHLAIGSHQADPKEEQREADDLLLAGLSTEEVLAAAGTKQTMSEQRLAALFRRRPASVALGVKRLSDGPALQVIAGALAAAGTTPSVQALSGVATDVARPSSVRVAALIGLQGIAAPSTSSMHLPVTLLDDADPAVRNAARLAAGALARSGRTIHARESEAIDAVLIARTARAATSRDKQDYLAALGNSGGPSAIPVVSASLADQDEAIRVSAARALRLTEGPEADALLASTATTDATAAVRSAALFAMGFRETLTTPAWDAVLKAAREDEATAVRSRAITIIRNNATRPPESDLVLDWIARHDRVDSLRALAARSLAEISRPAGLAAPAP